MFEDSSLLDFTLCSGQLDVSHHSVRMLGYVTLPPTQRSIPEEDSLL
jgi:hypothetical protein